MGNRSHARKKKKPGQPLANKGSFLSFITYCKGGERVTAEWTMPRATWERLERVITCL